MRRGALRSLRPAMGKLRVDHPDLDPLTAVCVFSIRRTRPVCSYARPAVPQRRSRTRCSITSRPTRMSSLSSVSCARRDFCRPRRSPITSPRSTPKGHARRRVPSAPIKHTRSPMFFATFSGPIVRRNWRSVVIRSADRALGSAGPANTSLSPIQPSRITRQAVFDSPIQFFRGISMPCAAVAVAAGLFPRLHKRL